MKREAKSRTSTNTVRWNYLANDGRKAERYGPYLLQADIERSFVDSRGLAQREVVPLGVVSVELILSLIHISEPTRLLSISYAVFCLKKKKKNKTKITYNITP